MRARLLPRLRRDARGVAMIEFAIVLPFLALLFVGGYQISDAVFAYRKVTRTARTLADLTSQYTQVSNADLDQILDMSRYVMSPYPDTDTELRVSQIVIDDDGVARVDWSRARNTAPYVANSLFSVPATYRQNGSTLLVAETTYKFVPAFARTMIGPLNLTEQVTMYPRKSASVVKVSS